ncbi:MAG: hypothetical protein Q9196_005169, partial [Gyalolechia fulgens]
MTTAAMDSSWIACFTERWQQHRLVDNMPEGDTLQQQAHASEQPLLDRGKTLSHPETVQLQMQTHNPPRQDQENSALVSNHTARTTSAISPSAADTTS